MNKKYIGKWVLVKFWDHAHNCGHPIYSEVAGKLIDYDAKSFKIRPWDTPNDKGIDNETYSVLRKVVDDFLILR